MGSIPVPSKQFSSLPESSCGYFLQELKMIWDEVGQEQHERQKILVELEQECLEIYKRKVDRANASRSLLHQLLAESEAELTHLMLSLGERSLPGRPDKMKGSLKERLDSIAPALEEMQLRKEERVNQFRQIQMQIHKIRTEIAGELDIDISPLDVTLNENDLSLNKLEEYQVELQKLQKNKNERLSRVEGFVAAIRKLSEILGMDSTNIILEIHPSLDVSCGGKLSNISNAILAELNCTVESLEGEKIKRLEKIQRLGKALEDLWNLMETDYEDRKMFSHVSDLRPISAAEISKPGSLAYYIIDQAEAEVEKLDQLKASKMKELFLKKQTELVDICVRTHMEMPPQSELDKITDLINSGEINHDDLLKNMDEQIIRAKDEAFRRKPIMEKVEKWMLSCDEERWLEEYARDENRYSVSRGSHKNLKRAERARVIVSKIPGLVDLLVAMTKSWEEESKKVFLYDQVPLLAILEEYNLIKQEKEDEKQKQREEKKRMQLRAAVAQENLFANRPATSSSRRLSNVSINGGFGSCSTPLNRRLSVGFHQQGSNSINSASKDFSFVKEDNKAIGR
ncbi:hypothetical protein Scep_018179 [Stephania cephalantha]|uniref:65-kDa microtubule-associated protein 8 n=1 Tax=Stephania cephalantha TaxID=152367 RepID=A0AAP0NXM9_9MAGN